MIAIAIKSDNMAIQNTVAKSNISSTTIEKVEDTFDVQCNFPILRTDKNEFYFHKAAKVV